MFQLVDKMPPYYQGVLYIIVGIMAALYAFGILERGIDLLIIGLALYSIIVGCYKTGILHALSSQFNRPKR